MPYMSDRATGMVDGLNGMISGWGGAALDMTTAGLAFGSDENKGVTGSSAMLTGIGGLLGAGSSVASIGTTWWGSDAKNTSTSEKVLGTIDSGMGILKGLGSMTSGVLGGVSTWGGDKAKERSQKGENAMNYLNGVLSLIGVGTGIASNLRSSSKQKDRSEDALIDAGRGKHQQDVKAYDDKIAEIDGRKKTKNPITWLWRHHEKRKAKKELRDAILNDNDQSLANAKEEYRKAKRARRRGRIKAGIDAATGLLGGTAGILAGAAGNVKNDKLANGLSLASKVTGAFGAVGSLGSAIAGSWDSGKGILGKA